MGDRVAARMLAERNVQAFRNAGVETVLVACATGGKTLSTDYPRILGEEGALFSSSVKNAVEFIAESVPFKTLSSSRTVTYHDPCHLRWGQGIYREARDVLKNLSQYEEMPNADRCCGMGGTFSLFFHDISRKIANRKMDAIAAADADIVATACPGCMLQLNEGIQQRGMHKYVKHLVEIVEEAVRE
jgi:glycolate oxidase iron-sulfur subunit